MSVRAARRLVTAGWLLTIALTTATLLALLVSGAPALPNRFGISDAAVAAFGFLQLTFSTVGVLVLRRLPRHVVGWLLLGTGLFYALTVAAVEIAFAAAADASIGIGVARWGAWVAWLASVAAGLALFSTVLLFPTGRISSPVFTRLLGGLGIWNVALVLTSAVQPGPTLLLDTLDNPIGIGPDLVGAAREWIYPIGGGVPAVIATAALTVRFRVTTGIERQQLKWFLAATAVMVPTFAISVGLSLFDSDGRPAEWPLVAFGLASASIPVAIGFAVLRYRLYEIDRIISRTLAYTALTAALALVYVAAFVVLQAILAPFTQSGGPLAVAASTLAVFALFQPLRRRLQAAMDRRFNRSRYDAQRTVEAFAARLRDEVDLERVGGAVQTVVGQALAPASVGIWLRPSGRPVER